MSYIYTLTSYRNPPNCEPPLCGCKPASELKLELAESSAVLTDLVEAALRGEDGDVSVKAGIGPAGHPAVLR